MRAKFHGWILGTLVGATVFSSSLLADAPVNAIEPNASATVAVDQQLADKVGTALRKYPYYGVFDWVTGYTKEGVVTLQGAIYQPGRKDDYTRLAAKVSGVKSVVNEIQVLPISSFDDSLRIGAARAIYRNPDFLDLAIQPNPPVHVIVENGRIRLEGVVRNAMERQLAEVAVRSRTMAFEVVNNLRIES